MMLVLDLAASSSTFLQFTSLVVNIVKHPVLCLVSGLTSEKRNQVSWAPLTEIFLLLNQTQDKARAAISPQ